VAEDRLLRLLCAAGIPEPIVNTRGILGLARDEPDFVWLQQRLNVEVDGGHHDEPRQRMDDRERDAEIAEIGFLVGRVGARELWTRPRKVIRWIVAAMEGRPAPVDPRTRRIVI